MIKRITQILLLVCMCLCTAGLIGCNCVRNKIMPVKPAFSFLRDDPEQYQAPVSTFGQYEPLSQNSQPVDEQWAYDNSTAYLNQSVVKQ